MIARIVCISVTVSLALCAYLRADGEPSVSELISLAPVIDIADPQCNSAEISASIRGGVGENRIDLRFRAVYAKPDRYALVVSDGSDATPLLWLAGDNAILYDPTRPAVFWLANAKPLFFVRLCDEKLEFGFAVGMSAANIQCDVKSILAVSRRNSTVERTAQGSYRMALTSWHGDYRVATIDPASASPYRRVEIFVPGQSYAQFSLDRMSTNENVDEKDFQFPERAALAAHVNIQDWPSGNVIDAVNGPAIVYRAIFARLAMRASNVRDLIPEIDWDQAAENDRVYSKAIRDSVNKQ